MNDKITEKVIQEWEEQTLRLTANDRFTKILNKLMIIDNKVEAILNQLERNKGDK